MLYATVAKDYIVLTKLICHPERIFHREIIPDKKEDTAGG
jgi:hypothetical protein